MNEIVEFRINNKYAHFLLKNNEINSTQLNTIIYTNRNSEQYEKIKILTKRVKEKYNDFFFLYSNIKREYTKKELADAVLLHVKIKSTFEPPGEQCGTLYNEMLACEICGANREQLGSLRLEKKSIPNDDIARTIAGEVVVSKKLSDIVIQNDLKGLSLEPVFLNGIESNTFQLTTASRNTLDLSDDTIAGVNVFDNSEGNEAMELIITGKYKFKLEKEVYKCPKGHTIGLNLLSEPYILNSYIDRNIDFFSSKQKIGVKRGFLRPEPIYFCSQKFKRIVEEENLKGFDFEIAHLGR